MASNTAHTGSPGNLRTLPEEHTSIVYSCAFSPDGSQLVDILL